MAYPLVWQVKQPANSYGTDIVSVENYLDNLQKAPVVHITAVEKNEFGEMQLLWFDVSTHESILKATGKIEVGEPRFNQVKRVFDIKPITRTFDSGQIDMTGNKVTVNEFANDWMNIVAEADINNDNQWVFSSIGSLIVNDTVRIYKVVNNNTTIVKNVKITAIDSNTRTITFDSNVTIQQGDGIMYITSDNLWCTFTNKTISTDDGSGKSFDYYSQFIERKVSIDEKDFTGQTFKTQDAKERFKAKYFDKVVKDIYLTIAKQLRYGTWVWGNSSKIKGYDVIIEEREAEWLNSIIDFSSDTTAENFKDRLANVLYRVNKAPVNSKYVLICNEAFRRSYVNMLQSLADDQATKQVIVKTCQPESCLYDGLMKWNLTEAPMIDAYVSPWLSQEYSFEGKAYIIPIDLVAAFYPKSFNVLTPNGLKEVPYKFGTVRVVAEPIQGVECKSYSVSIRLWFMYAGVSFRDTYFRLDNFTYKLD